MRKKNVWKDRLARLARLTRPVTWLFEGDTAGLSARVAYFLALSILPLLIFILSLLRGMDLAPSDSTLSLLFPGTVRVLLEETLEAAPPMQNITILTLAVTLWSGSAAVWALMVGVYHIHTGKRDNPPLIGRLISLVFTLGLAVLIGVSLGLLVFGRSLVAPLLARLGLESALFLSFLPRAGVAAGLFFFLLLLYRFTPGFTRPMRALWPGALLAAAGWMLVSWGFEFYVTAITRWTVVYGSLGLFLGLLFWLYLIALLTLLGARINTRVGKRQTKIKV